MTKSYKNSLPLIMAQMLFSGGLGVSGKEDSAFHLPDIPEEEYIRVCTPRIRKHSTKKRRNKLHDKKREGGRQ